MVLWLLSCCTDDKPADGVDLRTGTCTKELMNNNLGNTRSARSPIKGVVQYVYHKDPSMSITSKTDTVEHDSDTLCTWY